jgi:hypothetical protein
MPMPCRALFLSILLIILAPLHAQEPLEKTYVQIDLLFFQKVHATKSPQDATINPVFLQPINYELVTNQDKQPVQKITPLLLLQPKYYQMKTSENYLRNNPNYHIITHLAWRMPLYINGKKVSLHFNQDAITNTLNANKVNPTLTPVSLEGIMRINYQTYLNTNLHIIIKQNEPKTDQTDEPIKTYWRYLNQSRRMQPNKLNYFDHPMLGILMKVTPLS